MSLRYHPPPNPPNKLLPDLKDPPPALQDEYAAAHGTVLAADFYHANTLLPLSDEEIVARVMANVAACEPAFAAAKASPHPRPQQAAGP